MKGLDQLVFDYYFHNIIQFTWLKIGYVCKVNFAHTNTDNPEAHNPLADILIITWTLTQRQIAVKCDIRSY